GDFFVAIGMIDQLSYPLISLAGITRQLIAIKPTCQKMNEILKDTMPVQEADTDYFFKDRIQFQNVHFAYDSATPILNGLNLTIEKGKRYLLQGPSGCGKTTAVNLLLRYYDVNSGEIYIDDNRIDTFNSTYGFMTVVRQEATLFNDTLRNNLTMYQNVTDADILSALNSVGLEKFASTDMLNSVVSEDGSNFSGGEKKRICLARALLRHTDILILDEPLANLDTETAERIEELLLSIKDKTLIIVSHQFSQEKISAFDAVLDFS
ncbi:MAG: ABC transporter ATP-binding protein, partial [Clostridia bacterium]|nr:ABC transporter ATP-binding protein [Clostridia bacterium]